MHVMLIHPNFPTQFTNLALYLTLQRGWQCTYVTSVDTTEMKLPFNHINYRVYEGPQPKVFHSPPTLQGLIDHLQAVYTGLSSVPQIQPDLVIGHMSYGTMLYLRTLYRCPFIGYYDLLPPPFWTETMAYRKEFPPPERVRLLHATYHALTHLHYHAVDHVYTSTHFQAATAPADWQPRIKVFCDGVNSTFFQPKPIDRPLEFRGVRIGPETRVVTFVSPGLESVRGFDIFMKAVKLIAQEVPEVLFLIAGDERTIYGHELHYINPQSFKQWVLGREEFPLERCHFLGIIPDDELGRLYNLSDVHISLTVPHLVCQSLLQAMACGCVVVGSNTSPVTEFIDDGRQGLLTDFYDVEGIAERTIRVLRDPGQYRPIGQAARERIREQADLEKCLGALADWFHTFQVQVQDDLFASFGGPAIPQQAEGIHDPRKSQRGDIRAP